HLQIPSVVGVGHELPCRFLAELELTNAVADGVVDSWREPAFTVVEVTFEDVNRATAYANFASGHFDGHFYGLGAFALQRLRMQVSRGRGRYGCTNRESVSAGHEQEHHEDEQERSDRGADRKGGEVARILRTARAVPNHAGAYEDKDERPIGAD